MNTVKYLIVIIVLIAATSVFASNTGDSYGYKYLGKRLYDGITDVWEYDVYKNEKVLRQLNVYVKRELSSDAAVIYVDFNYNSTWNLYTLADENSIDNFWDNYRTRKYSVTSLKEAVNLAVTNYIEDQIASKK